jgi:hypothetical protein
MAEASPAGRFQANGRMLDEPVTLLAQTVNTLAEKMGTLVDAVGAITQATRNTQDDVARIGRELYEADERMATFDERLTAVEERVNSAPPPSEGRESAKRGATGDGNPSRKRRAVARGAKGKGKVVVDEGQGLDGATSDGFDEVPDATEPSPITGTFHERLGFTDVIVPQSVKSKITTYVRETWQELSGRGAFVSKVKGTWMLAEAGWPIFLKDLSSVFSFEAVEGTIVCSKN